MLCSYFAYKFRSIECLKLFSFIITVKWSENSREYLKASVACAYIVSVKSIYRCFYWVWKMGWLVCGWWLLTVLIFSSPLYNQHQNYSNSVQMYFGVAHKQHIIHSHFRLKNLSHSLQPVIIKAAKHKTKQKCSMALVNFVNFD